jgi:hypothetical protein
MPKGKKSYKDHIYSGAIFWVSSHLWTVIPPRTQLGPMQHPARENIKSIMLASSRYIKAIYDRHSGRCRPPLMHSPIVKSVCLTVTRAMEATERYERQRATSQIAPAARAHAISEPTRSIQSMRQDGSSEAWVCRLWQHGKVVDHSTFSNGRSLERGRRSAT